MGAAAKPSASTVVRRRMAVSTSARRRRSGCVEADAAGGEQRGAGRAGHRRQEVEALAVVRRGSGGRRRRTAAGRGGGAARRRRATGGRRTSASGRFGRQQRHHQPVRVLEQVVAGDAALALGRFHPALGEQPREAAVGGAVGGPGEVLAAVGSGRRIRAPGTKRSFPCAAATWPRTSPAKELRSAMPIAGVAERLRLLHQLVRVRGAFEEGEVGERAEFGVPPAHSKRPCSHQRGASPGRTWPERQTQRRAPPASSTW